MGITIDSGRVEILRNLRPKTAVRTKLGLGVVWCQVRNRVTVQVGQTVAVFERHEIEVAS